MAILIILVIPAHLGTLQVTNQANLLAIFGHGGGTKYTIAHPNIDSAGQHIFAYSMGEALRPWFQGEEAYKLVFESLTTKGQMEAIANAMDVQGRIINAPGNPPGAAAVLKTLRQMFWGYAQEHGSNAIVQWCRDLVAANMPAIRAAVTSYQNGVFGSQLTTNLPPVVQAPAVTVTAPTISLDIEKVMDDAETLVEELKNLHGDFAEPYIDILAQIQSFATGDIDLKELFSEFTKFTTNGTYPNDDFPDKINPNGKRIRSGHYERMILPIGNEPRRYSAGSTGTSGTEATFVASEDGGDKQISEHLQTVDDYLANTGDIMMRDLVADREEEEDPSKALNRAVSDLVTGARERLLPSQQ